MRIAILGCGRLGSRLAKTLAEEGEEVVIIDKDEDTFKKLGENFSGQQIVGSAFTEEVLKQALEEKTEVFVAATSKDNINIMFGQLAKTKYKVPRVIIRVLDPSLAGVYQELGLETVCPTSLTLNLIIKTLRSS